MCTKVADYVKMLIGIINCACSNKQMGEDMTRGGKNGWSLLLLILAGVVLGGFLGYLARDISFLSWLNYGQEFGIGDTKDLGLIRLNLGVMTITFGLTIRITIASIIGIFIGIFVYKKI